MAFQHHSCQYHLTFLYLGPRSPGDANLLGKVSKAAQHFSMGPAACEKPRCVSQASAGRRAQHAHNYAGPPENCERVGFRAREAGEGHPWGAGGLVTLVW